MHAMYCITAGDATVMVRTCCTDVHDMIMDSCHCKRQRRSYLVGLMICADDCRLTCEALFSVDEL